MPVTSPFSWTTPRFDGADAKFFEIALANARGGSLCKARIRIHPAVLAPPPGQSVSTEFVLPRFGQHGGRTEITGPFDGRIDTTGLRLGDDTIDIAAESPRKAVFFGPTTIVGETTLVLTERTTTVRIEYRHVKVSLSAPKTNLQRGEQTTLTATVTGLANLKTDVPLYLEKFGVVRMDRGDAQVVECVHLWSPIQPRRPRDMSRMNTPAPPPTRVMVQKPPGSSACVREEVWPPTRPATVLPMAAPRNQVPIMRLTNRGGESLVTFESPTGERHSSPKVWMR